MNRKLEIFGRCEVRRFVLEGTLPIAADTKEQWKLLADGGRAESMKGKS